MSPPYVVSLNTFTLHESHSKSQTYMWIADSKVRHLGTSGNTLTTASDDLIKGL
jgi:hypothetical protein